MRHAIGKLKASLPATHRYRKGQGSMEMSGLSRLGKAVAGAALAVALVMPLAASAQDATVTPYQPVNDLGSLSGTITADGSSTVGPITEALAEDFAKNVVRHKAIAPAHDPVRYGHGFLHRWSVCGAGELGARSDEQPQLRTACPSTRRRSCCPW